MGRNEVEERRRNQYKKELNTNNRKNIIKQQKKSAPNGEGLLKYTAILYGRSEYRDS